VKNYPIALARVGTGPAGSKLFSETGTVDSSFKEYFN
jgi:hypothetical protein